jgi:membrane fusion protein, multidrug efflux system
MIFQIIAQSPAAAITSDPVNTKSGTAESSSASPPSQPKGKHRVRYIWMALVALVVIVALVAYVPRIFIVATDDAYVEADTVTVIPKVPAYVSKLFISDNSAFTKGQLLVELDPRDYQVALDIANADLATAEVNRENILAQIVEQQHIVAATQAAVAGDQATLTFAMQQLSRYNALSKSGADTKERSQLAQSDTSQRQAALQHDLAALDAAKSHVMVLQSEVNQAEAAIEKAKSVVAQAQLNLSYTKIYAPSTGTVANKTVQAGNYVQPGQALFSAVPREVYVIANIKETQLGPIRVGQRVTLKVDAQPGETFHGHVDSFQRGTGSNFALLPPENATGNFVKIVQRVPVKIVLDDKPQLPGHLSPGMSVIPYIIVRQPPWPFAHIFE